MKYSIIIFHLLIPMPRLINFLFNSYLQQTKEAMNGLQYNLLDFDQATWLSLIVYYQFKILFTSCMYLFIVHRIK